MNSQIYDLDDHNAQSEDCVTNADQAIAELELQRAEIAKRRRALAEPSHKLVAANPTAMHHKITLGAVLVNETLAATDADALAGLLALPAADFAERFAAEAAKRPNVRASVIIVNLLDIDGRELGGRGLFEEWERRLTLYLEDRSEWLARDEDFRLEGEWRQAPMTADQRWLIRVTCRVLRIAIPGHLLRGQAADWLEHQGANLNYGDFK